MPRKSEARRSQTAGSGSSSDHVVNVEMPDGSSDGIGFCIFKVPQILAKIDQKAYQPNTVPIGPYHHRKRQFRKIQEHKRRFFTDLLNRTNQGRNNLKHFAEALQPMEKKVRKCYSEVSEVLAFKGDELIEMMVLDGCFIIELFCKYSRKLAGDANPGDDPLLTEPWVLPFLMRDLAKLENQIPWFILERLFGLTLGSWNESHPSLPDLALSFFNRVLQRPKKVLKKYSDWDGDGKHLLNFLRLTYDPDSPETEQRQKKFLRVIQPASKLHQAGIKFKPTHCDSFMDVKFSNGVLEIPVLKFDDFMSSLFLNFIAFEQCHRGSSKHVTTYATFMACLLNTPADAGLLCDRNIIERYFGTDEKIAHFFSNIGKDVVFDIHKNYLCQVFEGVNTYNEQDWRVHWASFKNTYFNTRWSLISAVAAFILLALATIQSFFAVYAYYRPPSSSNSNPNH
ncbi:Protein kinase domain-containing protein [Psidium guajava]|nr:Protein kinase domain-containing protein [Psidium guajava]